MRLLGRCGSAGWKGDAGLPPHVICKQAYRMDTGQKGQSTSWHNDEAPIFQTSNGQPLPDHTQMAPLVLKCMYFLNDLDMPQDGGTRLISGSHRFGSFCNDWAALKHPQLYAKCPAGSLLILSAHTWHRLLLSTKLAIQAMSFKSRTADAW